MTTPRTAAPRLRLFRCPTCGVEEYRWRTYLPLPEGQKPAYVGEDIPVPVYCQAEISDDPAGGPFVCGAEMEQVLAGIRHDLLPESFVIADVDGKGERRISSLSELRQIERDSEQKHRNGEGQILNFRDFSQDGGNKRTNAFTGSSYETSRSRPIPKRRTVSDLPINVGTTKS